MLLFTRLEEDHVAGRDDDILVVDYKMALACGYVYKLPVDTTSRTPGRKLGPAVELVGSGTEDPQRQSFLLERCSGIMQIT
jgi:hypothetical protein